MAQVKKMKLSLAANPYFWQKQKYFDFYHDIASTNIDIIYLGETVCSKRREMKFEDWLDIASHLSSKGKQVVLSTMTLIEAASEFKYMNKICSQQDFLVEANDMAAVYLLSENRLPFVVGSAVNLYNLTSFNRFKNLGMKRWVVPVELGKDDLNSLTSDVSTDEIEIEYQVFGRMPLAYSARCFTARHHRLAKDDCQFKCLDYEQGIHVKTQEGDTFAQINGIQTQSSKVTNLLSQLSELAEKKVSVARISPVGYEDTINVINQFSDQIKGDSDESVCHQLKGLKNDYLFCNGYWNQIEGMNFVE
ncbi:MAG: U32 family peptidase [Kangiellaceae bacterium]|nr:U32 family peptidase [Kangiellaceae bacterium]MCW8997895.1 U32 family peptidase [Kangiellaceae bacterium]MCW9016961.1 U32 family peptidase [Kangiellaceae bacterium]